MPHRPSLPIPPSVAKPALRALAAAGVTRLDDLAPYSDADLLALHGVGPKAVRLLRAALAEACEADLLGGPQGSTIPPRP